MTNLIDDISTLTSVSKSVLNSMLSTSEAIICHSVVEYIADMEDYAEIDIGIGTLYIKSCEDGIHYKFLPSEHLEAAVSNSVRFRRSTLSKRVDDTLMRRITKTYKELL